MSIELPAARVALDWFAIVIVPLFCIGGVLVSLYYKNERLMRRRNLAMVIVCNVGAMLITIIPIRDLVGYSTMPGENSFPCDAHLVFIAFGPAMFYLCYVLKVYQLYHMMTYQLLMGEKPPSDTQSQLYQKWLTRLVISQKKMGSWYINKIWALALIPCVGFMVYRMVADPSMASGTNGCTTAPAEFFWTVITTVIMLAMLSTYTWRVRKQADAFYLGKEATAYTVLGLATFFLYIIIRTVGSRFGFEKDVMDPLMSVVVHLLLSVWFNSWWVCLMQVRGNRAAERGSMKSFKNKKKTKSNTASTGKEGPTPEQVQATKEKYPDLAKVLAVSEGVQAFTKHLQTEFSTENIVFWLEMQYWKKSISDASTKYMTTEFVNEAKQHYMSYIDEMAEMQVNIPDTMRAKIQTTLYPPDKKLTKQSTSLQLKVARQSTAGAMARNRASSMKSGQARLSAIRGSRSSEIRVAPSADETPTEVVGFDSKETADAGVPWGLFEDAEQEVFLLMSRDSFARFRKESIYADFIQTMFSKDIE